jgi:oligopeptide transport system substrate-binding protein
MIKDAYLLIRFLILLTGGYCCSGCGSNNQSDKMVFRYNESTGIATLDPAFAKNQPIIWATHQLYNTLVENNASLQVVPSLAKRWDISADGLRYTFYLRDDVYFHNNEAFPNGKGRKMTAADIVYSLGRITDKATASSGAWIFNGRVDSLRGFTALNDTTFQLQLTKPFKPILGILSMQYCSIVPKEVVEKYGKDFRRHPCGTGPFQFKDWEEGQALILLKNEQYFEKDSSGRRLPYLDAVKVSFFDNRATEFLLLQQGKLDFTNDIDPSFKDEVLTKAGTLKKEWEGRIQLTKHPYLNTEYLGILVDSTNPLVRSSPLRLKKLRQAMNYAFDRRKMMRYLRNSIGTPAESGFIPAGFPCFDSSLVHGYHYDIGKARQLLAEAGFPGGRNLPVIKLLTIPIYADLGSFVARQLEEAGIKVQVEVVQKSLLFEQTAQSKALFFRGSWIADYPDAENYLAFFYGKNPAPPNYTRYNNPQFNALYEACMPETNDSIRNRLYQQMDQLMINDAPVIPLWYDMVIHLVNNNVKGMQPNSLNLLELRRVELGR